MLNKLWPIFIIVSVIYGIAFGNIEYVNKSIFTSIDDSISLMISMFGIMCFWNGMIKILINTNLINRINKILFPIINILFPNLKNNQEVKQDISLNMSSNLLGIGNAATPYGIKAMEKLYVLNSSKNEISRDMAMLIVINAASIQIIPTTILAIRQSLGSQDITKILLPVWIVSFIVFIVVVLLTKMLIK